MEDKFTNYYEGWISAAEDYMGKNKAEAKAVVDHIVEQSLRGLDMEIFNKIRDLAGVR